ncbi:Acetyltransferase (GNAT) family protein [Ruminococcaceae bacterium YRB3002]|nr:Acetyltransferase (GNAT) family protein [Ruminococcaceae bacterium YRB3002]
MSEHAFEFRRATAEDATKLSHLIKGAMVTYCAESGIPEDHLESMTEEVSTIRDRITRNYCLCCFDDSVPGSEPVGTITLSMVFNPLKFNFSDKTLSYLEQCQIVGYISRFAVRRDLRSTGLGVELMNAILDIAAKSGCDHVLLHTAVSNTGMILFYKNRGFEIIDSESGRGYLRGLLGMEI